MRIFLLVVISFLFFSPQFAFAEQLLGQQIPFNIESSYDLQKRSALEAVLIKISPKLYWYADNSWWSALTSEEKDDISANINLLAEEFEGKIYPVLTRTFGDVWNPGIDKDERITVLIHPMKKEAGGYSNTADEYPKLQSPKSNEREMIYLAVSAVKSPLAKVFLAHELMHLITFNQKEKAFGVTEDTWLNEARAEYSATLLGYNKVYEGSNLQQRVRDFLNKPFDSLTEWQETAADYGVANLFINYLADHYGLNILVESLKMKKVGIESINDVLMRGGFQTNFSEIFIDWVITVFVNDCSFSENYCYFNENLKNFRITPLINYLPFSGESTLSISNTTKDWSGNWYKFIGGRGKLTLEFQVDQTINFTIPYLLEDSQGNVALSNLRLDQTHKGMLEVPDFGSKNISLTVIPIAEIKTSNFGKNEPIRTFFLSTSIANPVQKNTEPAEKIEISRDALIAELKSKILAIQLEIVRLLQQLIQLLQARALTR